MVGRNVGFLGGAWVVYGGEVGSAGFRMAGVDVGTSGGEVGSVNHSSGVGSGEVSTGGSTGVEGEKDMRVGIRTDLRVVNIPAPESEMEREKSEAIFWIWIDGVPS